MRRKNCLILLAAVFAFMATQESSAQQRWERPCIERPEMIKPTIQKPIFERPEFDKPKFDNKCPPSHGHLKPANNTAQGPNNARRPAPGSLLKDYYPKS
mgnify:CR=1 FL=1